MAWCFDTEPFHPTFEDFVFQTAMGMSDPARGLL
jgi:hypothetical protein